MDLDYLEMAYGLAEKGRGRTSPNPCVGAVIVKGGRIVGYGYHEEAGKPHAEIIALARAGRKAKGATIYLTLEPCVHWGRTPPCIQTLIRAGLKRAVISAVDPNPLVNRRGIRTLKKAGIEVTAGLLEEKSRKLNATYIKYITKKIPYITIKAAMSLDGRIAAGNGDSRWISSRETREAVHLLRGENDAVLVGIGTLLHDDPRLTVRHPLWPGKKVTRIVLDSRLRTPSSARIFSRTERDPVILFAGLDAPRNKARELEGLGATVIRVPVTSEGLDLGCILRELGRREIAAVFVEGGSRVLTSFIEKKLADKIVLTVSPKIIGGKAAPSWAEGKGVPFVRHALPVGNTRWFSIGGDWIVEGDL